MLFIKNQPKKNINLYFKKKSYIINSEDLHYFYGFRILSRRHLFFNKHFDFNQNYIFYKKKNKFDFKKKK